MKNLRELYDSEELTSEYKTAREHKIAETVEWLANHLREPDAADYWAEDIMRQAEEHGDIENNTIRGEIPARYTRKGRPLIIHI